MCTRIYFCLGCYNQGVEDLPDYSKVHFPNMEPLPFSLVLPQAHAEELSFLQHFLVLNPQCRLSAQDALHLPYFATTPLPSPCSDLRMKREANTFSKLLAKGKPVSSVEEFLGVVNNLVSSDVV